MRHTNLNAPPPEVGLDVCWDDIHEGGTIELLIEENYCHDPISGNWEFQGLVRYAAYGYEAMAVVLDSIRRAGDSATDRQAVIDAFFATSQRDSVLGTYSIDEVGDSTLDRMAGYRLGAGGTMRFATALRVR